MNKGYSAGNTSLGDIEAINNSFQWIWADLLRSTIQRVLETGGNAEDKQTRQALIMQFLFADSQLELKNKNKGFITFANMSESQREEYGADKKVIIQRYTLKLLNDVPLSQLFYAVGEKQRTAGLTPYLISSDSGIKGELKARGIL